MKHNPNRVRVAQEIRTVPDYAKLSKALQNDMLDAAQHIRNALYDNPHMKTLEIALIALDFPQFIPIPNTVEALEEELDRLWEEWFYSGTWSLADRIDDLEDEIERRKKPQAKASHEFAIVRYNWLYNNTTYSQFRYVARLIETEIYDWADICSILTDAAIEICHLVVHADVPEFYCGKTAKLRSLIYMSEAATKAAIFHLANFASLDVVTAYLKNDVWTGR